MCNVGNSVVFVRFGGNKRPVATSGFKVHFLAILTDRMFFKACFYVPKKYFCVGFRNQSNYSENTVEIACANSKSQLGLNTQ